MADPQDVISVSPIVQYLFVSDRLTLITPLFLRSILECEKLVKATYHRNGLVYRESSSEDEAGGGGLLSSEVIEIDDDDDDDVIAVGCCKSHHFLMRSYHSLTLRPENSQVIKMFASLWFYAMFQWFLQRSLSLLAKIQW